MYIKSGTEISKIQHWGSSWAPVYAGAFGVHAACGHRARRKGWRCSWACVLLSLGWLRGVFMSQNRAGVMSEPPAGRDACVCNTSQNMQMRCIFGLPCNWEIPQIKRVWLYVFLCAIMQITLTPVGSRSDLLHPTRQPWTEGLFFWWHDSPSLSIPLVCSEARLCYNGNSLKGRLILGVLEAYL